LSQRPEPLLAVPSAVPARLDHGARSDGRVLARSSLTVAGRLVSKLAIVLFLIVAARLLSKDEYGIYSYVLVLAGTFAILADPQVTVIAGRDVSSGRHSAAASYWSALPVVLATGMLAAVAMLGFALVARGPGETLSVLLVAGGYVVFNRLSNLGLDMLRAVGRIGTEAAIETAGTVLLIAVAAAVAAAGLGVTAVLAVFLAHAIAVTLVCHAALAGEVGRPARGSRAHRRALVRTGCKLAVGAGGTAIATRGPLIVLGVAGSAAAVASFSAGLRFADALYMLALTAGQALLPSIAAMLRTDPARAPRVARKAMAVATVGGAALALALAPLAGEITRLVFGAQYASSGPLMAPMLASVPFMGVMWISWFALCAYQRESDVLRVTAICAPVCLLAAVLVIPGAGARGAAWVYVGAIALLALATYATFELRVRRVAA
jgi:O-antigen/teichoic acid export membrane protein